MGGRSIVAVVDDDESVRLALSSLLRSVGFEVLLFSSAEEFLQSRNLDSIGCLILDWHMPGMSGLQLQTHASDSGWSIPIIFLTAHYSEERRAQALSSGAVAFLHKPVDSERLLEAVRTALARE
jgi:FixJ family two-component response regulator